MILDRILQAKQTQVAQEKQRLPLVKLMKLQEEHVMEARDFRRALLHSETISIIAEVKKASPSKGVIREDFDPLAIALDYEKNQVEAVSVLTEREFFQGDDQYLLDIRQQVGCPVLRKDFIIDEYQIYQSKILGADCLLLIVAALDQKQLVAFSQLASDLGMQCLVEVHNHTELERALASEAMMIGINNRNLATFAVRLEQTAELIIEIPQGKTVVSESGIQNYKDMQYLKSLGVDAVLVGESLMRAPSIAAKLGELRGINHG